jgi:hypothetical protein
VFGFLAGAAGDAKRELNPSPEVTSAPKPFVRRGGTLVSARVPDSDRVRLDAVLNERAVNLRDRSAAWQKSGWKAFDPASQPYGAEEVRKERQLYGGGLR